MNPTTFPDRLHAARTTVTYVTKAIAPMDPATVEILRAKYPTEVAKAEHTITMLTNALPYLTAILNDLEARACWKCTGTGVYAGASGYTRNGAKYCFRCNGRGYDLDVPPARKTTTAQAQATRDAAAAETTPAAPAPQDKACGQRSMNGKPCRNTQPVCPYHGTPAPAAPAAPAPAPATNFPTGRYTVNGHHYKIDRPTEGRWTGYTFIRELDTHGNQIRDIRDRAERDQICAAVAANPSAALITYGQTTGTCGMCQTGLKDPESVARGIGPYCEADLRGVKVSAIYRERKANPTATPAATTPALIAA